jgi:hypothetical protein
MSTRQLDHPYTAHAAALKVRTATTAEKPQKMADDFA